MCIVMCVISPRGSNFAHFFWKCALNLLTGKEQIGIVYILEFADGSRCTLFFANRAHHAYKSLMVMSQEDNFYILP